MLYGVVRYRTKDNCNFMIQWSSVWNNFRSQYNHAGADVIVKFYDLNCHFLIPFGIDLQISFWACLLWLSYGCHNSRQVLACSSVRLDLLVITITATYIAFAIGLHTFSSWKDSVLCLSLRLIVWRTRSLLEVIQGDFFFCRCFILSYLLLRGFFFSF